MTTVFVYALLAIIAIGHCSVADDGFRPMPIPLDQWEYDRREGRTGIPRDTFKTEAPTTEAPAPAHYWEDALRHSVYLSLVRDKIDHLITQGDISSETKYDGHPKKQDDHDLWEKIKKAPFESIRHEEPASFGEISSTVAKGRLIEGNGRFRFVEDKQSKENCGEKCMEGVRATWSVKRVKHVDASPGKYHYELTFSVIAQPPKKQRKPHETPVRTFTVRESTPEKIIEKPREPAASPLQRARKSLWFHKNISPKQFQGRRHFTGLDRIFSSFSLFSDDDEDAAHPPRYIPKNYMPPAFHPPHYPKVSYVGSSSEQHQAKKLVAYPFKTGYKFVHAPLPIPSLPPSPQHFFYDMESLGVAKPQYIPQPTDTKYHVTPTKPTKTTRPPLLPTPVAVSANFSFEDMMQEVAAVTEETTEAPELPTIYKVKVKPTPTKVNYFAEHVRPPVYNAPPGVFVTMDKKPFKPMPPLKFKYTSKPYKVRPADFKPSPQILDAMFSEPDTLSDTAFRPITVKYSENITSDAIVPVIPEKQHKKSNSTNRKPTKKHELNKNQRFTTATPDIITAGDNIKDDESTDWVNVLGAFSVTTPMVPETKKPKVATTTPMTSTTVSTEPPTTTSTAPPTPKRRTHPPSSTTTEAVEETTPATKKRTRPPPKFKSSDKIKKHKRGNTTSTTTPKPAPRFTKKKPLQDLAPQASSSGLASVTKSHWDQTLKVPTSTLPASSAITTQKLTTTETTPTVQTTTTTRPPTTVSTTTMAQTRTTIPPRAKNRFRQSTIMVRGTSVNHDKWYVATEKSKSVIPPTGFPPRRKASNFQGYVSTAASTTSQTERDRKYHPDQGPSAFPVTSSANEASQTLTKDVPSTSGDNELEYEESDDKNDAPTSTHTDDSDGAETKKEDDVEESKDQTEFIFESTSESIYTESHNEISETDDLSAPDAVLTASLHSAGRNKTKCKKKTSTTTEPAFSEMPSDEEEAETSSPTATTTTEIPTTPDIFEELFGGFTFNDVLDKIKDTTTTTPAIKLDLDEGQSETHERLVDANHGFDDFIDGLEDTSKIEEDEDESEQYEYEEPSTEEEDTEPDGLYQYSRANNDDTNDSEPKRPYSFLELLAME